MDFSIFRACRDRCEVWKTSYTTTGSSQMGLIYRSLRYRHEERLGEVGQDGFYLSIKFAANLPRFVYRLEYLRGVLVYVWNKLLFIEADFVHGNFVEEAVDACKRSDGKTEDKLLRPLTGVYNYNHVLHGKRAVLLLFKELGEALSSTESGLRRCVEI